MGQWDTDPPPCVSVRLHCTSLLLISVGSFRGAGAIAPGAMEAAGAVELQEQQTLKERKEQQEMKEQNDLKEQDHATRSKFSKGFSSTHCPSLPAELIHLGEQLVHHVGYPNPNYPSFR